ncbi:hypothetical protein K503DRAFT_852508 [Rhizopogon vinicolor AM-OR11-026]|uniref:Uncharacterized protein n=1 Tax=Rhizopogon vinicolor AM-OR11-026 TaxID=1314800 RepID=A0A1B7NIH7_9AGAM|nr:hypothetical protein K503DRAFT_852508 [Rhizopogon vinicolor AM-OR11-026]
MPYDHNEADHDMDVDVDGELDAAAIDEETRFLGPDATNHPAAAAPPVAPGQARKKSKADVSGKRLKRADTGGEAKKKKQVVYSDADDAEVDVDDVPDEDDAFDDGALSPQDDDFEPQPAPKRGGKAKASSSTKSKPAKAKPVLAKGGKGKAGKEKEKEKEIMIKDERKLPTPGSPPPSTSQTQSSNLFADDESSVPPPSTVEPSAAADHSTLPPPEPAKKRRLPTIKKNKPAATSTPSQSTAAASKPPPPSDDMTKPIAPANQQRKPAALLGATDFDLRDKSVYAELFKGAGGSTPRSGLNRREKEEERRKELNKMRDEAKAKRAEEAKQFFDLQSQGDKIARFEQTLRAHNGMALHPNFLAAKFREEYDRDRMRLRQSREGSQSVIKEEGEA